MLSARSERGQGLFEYALVIVFIAVVVIVILALLGPLVANWYDQVIGMIS